MMYRVLLASLLTTTALANVPSTTMTEEEVTAILGTIQGTAPTEYAEIPQQSMVPMPAIWSCIQIPDRTESPVLSLHLDETDRVTIFDDNGVFVRREKLVYYQNDIYGFDWTEKEQNWNFRFHREDDETMVVEIYRAETQELYTKLVCS
jgi:hypothetical protein